ncbi:MAG TPA: DUF503 domain-containing protein [Candidatus Saccharicenans sp.]|jgi:uncharacterized protein YlxP (DUF503 family)|nr:DUF503 domain-containing protein [Candidatus Saccharicenans sp.]HOL44882.1 DUF503 domain-containing protein [Candidatus Saccharicenans sp.]HOM93887.1 DUF503 domain-containing protein [Candidatus Saccharicenans sp.]HOT68699.1 DUF503 domain-containing protein [Candidatus Saccharicenans sp.]HPC87372.1 DUF503 domain-containing protein [Candidatus Saccharicenans sp.]
MTIGVLTLDFFLAYSHSLKEKRRFINSFIGRVQHRFNVSISEVDFQDSWQRTRIAVALVNSEGSVVRQIMDKILEEANSYPDAVLSGHKLDLY